MTTLIDQKEILTNMKILRWRLWDANEKNL